MLEIVACLVHANLLRCILLKHICFSLVILIIVLFFVNIVFYLLYLQVEPVFTCVLK